MQTTSLKLKIGHILPDILHSFCAEANVGAFKFRAKARNIEIEHVLFNNFDTIKKCDFYYIDGSNVNAFQYAIKYLKENQDIIKDMISSEVPTLAVNLGYALLSNSCQLPNCPKIKGLRIFNAETSFSKERIKCPIIGTCDFLNNETIVGYKNQIFTTFLSIEANPFLNVLKGEGNNIQDISEGIRYNNAIGTYITSPLLAQNPTLCDYLIEIALRIKYKTKIPLSNITDDVEWYCHDYMLKMK